MALKTPHSLKTISELGLGYQFFLLLLPIFILHCSLQVYTPLLKVPKHEVSCQATSNVYQALTLLCQRHRVSKELQSVAGELSHKQMTI